MYASHSHWIHSSGHIEVEAVQLIYETPWTDIINSDLRLDLLILHGRLWNVLCRSKA